jgi:hypothetical protein
MNFLSNKQNAKLTYCNCIKGKKNAIMSKLDINTVFASTLVQSNALRRSKIIRQSRGTHIFIPIKPLIDAPLRNTF